MTSTRRLNGWTSPTSRSPRRPAAGSSLPRTCRRWRSRAPDRPRSGRRCPGTSARTATCSRAVATPRRIGSAMPASAPFAVGRPMPSLAHPVCTGSLTRYWRKSAHCRLRSLPRARVAVTAAERRARDALTAGNRREREPAEVRADALLVRGERVHRALVPVTLELHRGLAVADQARRARRALLRRRRQEPVLERLRVEELLRQRAGLRPARVAEVVGDGRPSPASPCCTARTAR